MCRACDVTVVDHVPLSCLGEGVLIKDLRSHVCRNQCTQWSFGRHVVLAKITSASNWFFPVVRISANELLTVSVASSTELSRCEVTECMGSQHVLWIIEYVLQALL